MQDCAWIILDCLLKLTSLAHSGADAAAVAPYTICSRLPPLCTALALCVLQLLQRHTLPQLSPPKNPQFIRFRQVRAPQLHGTGG